MSVKDAAGKSSLDVERETMAATGPTMDTDMMGTGSDSHAEEPEGEGGRSPYLTDVMSSGEPPTPTNIMSDEPGPKAES